ncbi:unnamed protein product [Leuciscus chuanchicus]
METSVFSPAITSSPRPMSPAETPTYRGKRKRDCDFLDPLRDMEDANWAALQLGQEQCDKYMQLLLESQAEEREMRRQELPFLQSEAEESKTTFRLGFCLFVDSLPSHSKSSHNAQPPDLTQLGLQSTTEVQKSILRHPEILYPLGFSES